MSKQALSHRKQGILSGSLLLGLAMVLTSATSLVAQGGPGGGGPPPVLGPVPVPAQNPITESKRVLGKILFFEEQLSSDDTVSCGTCHKPQTGGGDPRFARHPGTDGILGNADDKFASPGVIRMDSTGDYLADAVFGLDVQVTDRHTPENLMSAHQPRLFWDGRAEGTFIDPDTNLVIIPNGGALENQAIQPLISDVEMAHTGRTFTDAVAKLAASEPMKLASNLPNDMAAAISANPTYASLFTAAFGDPTITAARIAMAMATYQRTLTPNQTPYDLFAAGNPNALTQNQRNGLDGFRGPARCDNCHTLPRFTDGLFHNTGLRPISEDNGLQGHTGNFADRGKFKTPSLRNAGLRNRYFHTGGLATLQNVQAFYAMGGGPNLDNKDPMLVPVGGPGGGGPNSPLAAVFDFVANGLTDPRVAAGTFPFDRPTLWSESNPAFNRDFGAGTAGTGGLVPELIVSNPPYLGNSNFRIGIKRAQGGAFSKLAIAATQLSSPVSVYGADIWVDINGALLVPQMLSGVGLAAGYSTWNIALPNDPSLSGLTVYAQWASVDMGAPGGLAATEGTVITLF